MGTLGFAVRGLTIKAIPPLNEPWEVGARVELAITRFPDVPV